MVAVVKGSKQYRLQVVKRRPIMWWTLAILLCVVLVACAWFSFQLGLQHNAVDREKAVAEVARLTAALAGSQKSVTELQQQVANIGFGAEVDRKSNEDVRQEVIALKQELAQLQEDNSFYRNLMAPTKNGQGLAFGAVELINTERARNFRYKVVLQQLVTNHQLLNGSLRFTVLGKLNGSDIRYELHELSRDVTTPAVKLRFKYFQTIEGQLVLPEAFEPEGIELVARSTGKSSVTVEKRFGWLVEEAGS